MSKSRLKIKAIKLRGNGLSIKSIAKKLQISTSTASLWCRNVTLSYEQITQLRNNYTNPYYGNRGKYIKRLKESSLNKINKLKVQGIKEVGKLSKRDLFIVGISLYWAEGFKKDKRLGFANSDPKMIILFLTWLIKCCKVPKEDIRLRVGLNISHIERIVDVEKYWSTITGISTSQFQKPFFQKFIWKKDFPNPNEYYGVLRIRANKQLILFRKIHGWIEGLKENSI